MMAEFLAHVNKTHALHLQDYWQLHQWSVENLRTFWHEIRQFCGLATHLKPDDPSQPAVVLEPYEFMDDFPRWFPGFSFNAAQALLFPEGVHDAQTVAIKFRTELDTLQCDLTWAELRAQVGRLQGALERLGVGAGDRIAAYAPNSHHAIVFMLAGATLGAVFTAAPPDFGAHAVIERFQQTTPRVLLACDTVWYNGRAHAQRDKLLQVLHACPSIQHTILIGLLAPPSLHGLPSTVTAWDRVMTTHEPPHVMTTHEPPHVMTTHEPPRSPTFATLPFSHPLYVLYSSGTTGPPKCIVHSGGGTLLQHAKEHKLHGDVRAGDCVLQYTTVGWMMWQWLVSCLAQGVCVVVYDGSPLWRGADALWRLVASERVTHFGTSAKFLQHLQAVRFVPTRLDLSALRCVFSTGSPLPADTFRYLRERVLGAVHVASMTGGTDIVSLFAGGCPLLAVHAGEIQAPCLGMDVAAVDACADGRLVAPGETGDLVCRRPFPSMPVGFWVASAGGADGHVDLVSCRAVYFPRDRLPAHVWHHGDFCRFSARTGGVEVLGRSDGTLNPAGVRFGSAELYALVLGGAWAAQVKDALAVGVGRADGGDEDVYLFVELCDSVQLSEALVQDLRHAIRAGLSARHVPAHILPCPAIPYTVNGKKVEVPVKRILNGDVGFVAPASIANPECLDFFRQLAGNLLGASKL